MQPLYFCFSLRDISQTLYFSPICPLRPGELKIKCLQQNVTTNLTCKMCKDNLNIKLKNLHEIFLLREHNFSKKIIDKKTYNHNIKILKETKILQCVCIFYLSMTYNNFLSSLQLRRTTADVFRMIPYLILIIIPFFEFLIPFYLKFFPNALPSTFGRDEKKVC